MEVLINLTGGVLGSLIAGVITYLYFYYRREAKAENLVTPSYIKTAAFSIFIATVIFMFGIVLQAAVQFLWDPNRILWHILSDFFDSHRILSYTYIFIGALLPGTLTGLTCAIGQTMYHRILFSILASIMALSLLDVIGHFYALDLVSKAHSEEIKSIISNNDLYFSLLSNLTGGTFAGIAIGVATHIFTLILGAHVEEKPNN